ncbi:hypothetical protein WS67_19285 [Burkholderia singularis]|uniref:Uncharacterized protein n=1 Tax=Burkholderia singularis TaxID=1503053 RepID=A0A118DML6_9BURK|nr:hypothetical protein WS67_19285 [Burkholderia singularis]
MRTGIGLCHLCIIAIGFAVAFLVGSTYITAIDKGGNLAAPLLAQALAGGPSSAGGDLMLAFMAKAVTHWRATSSTESAANCSSVTAKGKRIS